MFTQFNISAVLHVPADTREALAERLLELTGNASEISATHQQLASELGTAREVISRILSDFQKRDLIAQSRGRITLLDRSQLQKIAKAR